MSEGTIMHNYIPSSAWLLKQWTGTVIQYVWVRVIVMMAISALFCVIVHFTGLPLSENQLDAIFDTWDRYVISSSNFDIFVTLLNSHCQTQTLLLYSTLRSVVMTTFVLTFFLAQSLKFWQDFYCKLLTFLYFY
jgi:hypothetical protein